MASEREGLEILKDIITFKAEAEPSAFFLPVLSLPIYRGNVSGRLLLFSVNKSFWEGTKTMKICIRDVTFHLKILLNTAVGLSVALLCASELGYAKIETYQEPEAMSLEEPILWSEISRLNMQEFEYQENDQGVEVIVDNFISVTLDMNRLGTLPAGTKYVWFANGSFVNRLTGKKEFENPLVWGEGKTSCVGANVYSAASKESTGYPYSDIDVDQPVCRVELKMDYNQSLIQPGVEVDYESVEGLRLREQHSDTEERVLFPFEIGGKYPAGYKPWSFSGYFEDQYYTKRNNVVGCNPGYRRHRNLRYRYWSFQPVDNVLVKEVRCHKSYRTMHYYRYDSIQDTCVAQGQLPRSIDALKRSIKRANPNRGGAISSGDMQCEFVDIEGGVNAHELTKRASGVQAPRTASPMSWQDTAQALGDFISFQRPHKFVIKVTQEKSDKVKEVEQ